MGQAGNVAVVDIIGHRRRLIHGSTTSSQGTGTREPDREVETFHFGLLFILLCVAKAPLQPNVQSSGTAAERVVEKQNDKQIS
jgi:hypothetical protein